MNPPVLQCENLVSAQAPSLPALNLELSGNTLTCIVGPADSGKTLYLRLLGGADMPAQGQLHLLGQNVWALSRPEWQKLRRRVGYILPNSALLSSSTALQNIMLPALYHCLDNNERIEQRAHEILHWLEYIPDDRLAADLPAYHQRLIAIARCLILDPEILFVDEAFAFLDGPSRIKMAGHYLDMRTRLNITLILATDNLAFARQHADALLFTHPDGARLYHGWKQAESDANEFVQSFIQNSNDDYKALPN